MSQRNTEIAKGRDALQGSAPSLGNARQRHPVSILNVFCDYSVLDFNVQFMGRRATVERFFIESNKKTSAAIASMLNRITFEKLLSEGKHAYNN
eukprot:scaffold20302_cov185-Amphora_coffeaeformis.AAC.4